MLKKNVLETWTNSVYNEHARHEGWMWRGERAENMAENVDWSQAEPRITCPEFWALPYRQRETSKGLLSWGMVWLDLCFLAENSRIHIQEVKGCFSVRRGWISILRVYVFRVWPVGSGGLIKTMEKLKPFPPNNYPFVIYHIESLLLGGFWGESSSDAGSRNGVGRDWKKKKRSF